MRPFALLLCGGLVLFGATPAAAAPSSPEERAAAIARPAVVFVEVDWQGWVRDPRTGEVFGGAEGYRTTTSCSGVVVHEDGRVLTAGHCVDPGPFGGGGALIDLAIAELTELGRVRDPEKAAAQLAEHAVVEGEKTGSGPLRDIRVTRVVGDGDSSDNPGTDVAPATVTELMEPEAGDVALLKVPRTGLPALTLADEDDRPAGTPILAIGFPASVGRATDPSTEPTNKNGQISARRSLDGKPYYEISAAASQGMSGGPLVDMDGRVLGLVTAAPAGETQSFNLATASTSALELLRGNGITPGPGAIDRNFNAGLTHYFDGDYAEAVEFFDAVLAATPDHRQAQEYRARAEEHGSGGPGLLVILIVVCGGIAVLSGAAATILLARRRRADRDLPTPPMGIPMPVTGTPEDTTP
jgi:hypothetical protein